MTANEHTSSGDSPGSGTMPTATLGAGGPSVGRLALGTMTFGVETDETDAFEQLDRFVAAGGTMIDTADVYGSGESERIIGRWLADRRPERVIVATKGRFAPPPGSAGASRRSLVRSVDASLDRLGVERIDLYYVHAWDQDTPVADTLDTLSGLVRAGKVHHLGWSNLTGYQLGTILTTARLAGHVAPTVLQPQYNLLDRTIEYELIPACLDSGTAVVPWSPLGGGWLTGKYRPDTQPTGATRLGEDPTRGVESYEGRNIDRTWRILDVVNELADGHGLTPGQVAIAWLLTRPTVASVLLGARTPDQLSDNLGVVDVRLGPDEIDRLTSVSAPGLPDYPYGMLERYAEMTHWKILGTAAGS